MKILAIHGIGHQENFSPPPPWHGSWDEAIKTGISGASPTTDVEIAFLEYDDLFESVLAELGIREFTVAAFNLISGAVGDRFRGLFSLSDDTRWFAGMVVVWVNHEELRARLRDRLQEKIAEFEPDVILGHSMGSLLAYDFLSNNPDATDNRTLITLGSQLGNTFVRAQFAAGRVSPLPMRWFHLYNANDAVFTAPLDFGDFQTAERFKQIDTTFGQPIGFVDFFSSGIAANHGAVPGDSTRPQDAYLTQPETVRLLWPELTGQFATRSLTPADRAEVVAALPKMPIREIASSPKRRALLIGVNNAREAPPLEGCVNDVFLVSSVLQESGFQAEDIRVVLDDRATCATIQERLHWLLDGVRPGDQRFLYYSGHGAMLPTYGPDGTIDHTNPCLVPYDFAWTEQSAITDRTLLDFYSQIPYDARLMMVFDCCHAGGLARGALRPRGLEPPDDIRHRMLRWNRELQMWQSRELPPANKDLAKSKDKTDFLGASGADFLLGRAIPLRTLTNKKYDKVRDTLGHKGPFMPVVLEACTVEELAFEYDHGAIGHGAFTFAIATVLRRSEGKLTYAGLTKETTKVLKALGYNQNPAIVGPKEVLNKRPVWRADENSSEE